MQLQQPPPQGHVVYIQTAPAPPNSYEIYNAKTSISLGITRIVIGVLSIIFQIATIVVDSFDWYWSWSYIGTGIWCGIFFILAGSFGVGAGVQKSRCLIMTNMVMAILSVTLFVTTHLAICSLGIYVNECKYCSNSTEEALALFCVMLVLCVAQAVCDIWSAVICCRVVCCGPQTNNANAGNMVPGFQNAQVVFTNQPQMYPAAQQGYVIQQPMQQQQFPQLPVLQQPQGFAATANPPPNCHVPAQGGQVTTQGGQVTTQGGQVTTQGGQVTPPPAYVEEQHKL